MTFDGLLSLAVVNIEFLKGLRTALLELREAAEIIRR